MSEPAGPPAEAAPDTVAEPRRPRGGPWWPAIAVALVVLIALLIFVLQNLQDVRIHFLGLDGSFPLGVGLLLTAAAGAVGIFLLGSARILQIRRANRPPRQRRLGRRGH